MKIEERYPEIIQAALETFARRGYHQASIREIARAADLSLAGLYHYVKSKDELLFLVIDASLDGLLGKLEAAVAEAVNPEAKLLALIRTHLEFAFHQGAALKVINRDIEALAEPHRTAAATKRHSYLLRGLELLRALDPHGRSDDELLDATNLLLGMLNGIATRPFMTPSGTERNVAEVVKNLFLCGFLETGRGPAPSPARLPGARPGEAGYVS
ncbi:MAG: TetR/AcrR family transcriptional regulator [Candidatus Methylomirabilia bacterium]